MRSFSLVIVTFILAVFISSTVCADTTYIIKKGDNPYTIAKKFKINSQDIINANRLNPGNLKPGTRIAIPNKGEPVRKNRTAKDKKLTKSKNKKAVEHNVRSEKHWEDSSFHTVKKGETLLSIAKKYSVSVNDLREFNNLGSKKLKPGQKITIKKVDPKTYTVRKGDNIYQIAKRFNIEPDELKDINGLEADLLKPGQKILLEPEPEIDDTRNYEAILSEAPIEKELEKASESKELSELGIRDRLILFAKKMLDIPYRFGGNSLFGIDCSAYVKKVYSLIGMDIPRSARQQFQEGKPVDGEELSMGDLVFFRTYASFPSHVGIYLGNNLFIHASSRSKKVTIDSLETPYYLKRFIGAKRLIDLKSEKEDQPGEG